MGKTAGDEGFPAFLGRAMQAARLSSAELARRSGLNQSQISNWQRGKAQPSVDNLRRLAIGLPAPLLPLVVAAGHLTVEEAQLRDRPAFAVPETLPADEALRMDPALSDEARRILLAAYAAATLGPPGHEPVTSGQASGSGGSIRDPDAGGRRTARPPRRHGRSAVERHLEDAREPGARRDRTSDGRA